jgi:hypothetical protein
MAKLGGQLVEVFRSPAPFEVTRRHFADIDRIAAATGEVERFERIDDQTLHLVLKEQKHGPTTFRPDYVVRYRLYGDDEVTWETVHGNMLSEGRARFVPRADGGTDIDYAHKLSRDLPVPGLVARMLQPVVTARIAPGIRRFVDAMLATMPKA